MRARLTIYFPWILILFHVIGLILFWQSNKASDLTALNLLLCGGLVFLTEKDLKKAGTVLAIIFSGGFIIEWIGVQTGYLFGDYAYGTVLGPKLDGVSLIIGLNWYAVVVGSANVARWVPGHKVVQALIAGVLGTLLDFLIEPVAIKYKFWTWEGESIPSTNYLTWFGFATLFAYGYLVLSSGVNRTARWLFFIWIAFFIALNLI